MRIKTITCQKVNNHGANLQAYALLHYLEKMGHEVEIIDYCPEYFRPFRPFSCPERYKGSFFGFAYICAKLPQRFCRYLQYRKSARKANFEAFRKKYYKLTRQYTSFEALQADPPEADLYIAGSDQIWNTMMRNGKDPSFFLRFAPEGVIRATYAASFAVSELPEDLKPTIRDDIMRLDYVAVRERSAIRILEDLGITSGRVVLDPVFLLCKDEWTKMEADVVFDAPYLLVYDFEKSNVMKAEAIHYAKIHDLRIYSLQRCDYCDKSFEDCGPEMFLSLIHHASFVLSNSFHATAFSLIYEKNFFVIKRAEGINSRMTDLLEIAGLPDRIGTKLDFSIDKINIPYTEVKKFLDAEIQFAKQYLEEVTACDQ